MSYFRPFSRSIPTSADAAHGLGTSVVDATDRWCLAGMQVRLCVHPDEPRLIQGYLAAGHRLHAQGGVPLWNIALKSAELLLDSAADPGLPMHWRHQCLDHVFRPLQDLAALADCEPRRQRLAALRWKLATLDMSDAGGAYPGNDECCERKPASPD